MLFSSTTVGCTPVSHCCDDGMVTPVSSEGSSELECIMCKSVKTERALSWEPRDVSCDHMRNALPSTLGERCGVDALHH